MAYRYKITNWDEHFENSRTRTMKSMQWIPLPIKHDGDGYTELLDHPDGPAHFACWVTITQLAARCKPRGTLVRDNGEPHTPQTMARVTRIPENLFRDSLPRLVGIGWLTADCVETVGTLIGPWQEGMPLGKGIEGKEGTEIHTGRVQHELAPKTDDKLKVAEAPAEPAGRFSDLLFETEIKPKKKQTQVFTKDHWDLIKKTYAKFHPRAKPGDKERLLARQRVQDGYTPEDLCDAIEGCHKSPHHCGENEQRTKYQSLSLILRDSSHVAMFLELLATPKRQRKMVDRTLQRNIAISRRVQQMRQDGASQEEITKFLESNL